MIALKSIIKSIRLKFNKMGAKKRKLKLKSLDFSIISNNCYAGIIYQYLGLKYNTPTIGLYFYSDEYIKFLKKFDYYINQELKFIDSKDSKYYFDLVDKGYENKIIGVLDDIEIVFLHYTSRKEAYEKWNRRCQRLSNNLIFKFNDQNLCKEKNIYDFSNLKFKNKICFTSKNYPELKCNIWLKKYNKFKFIKEDYYSGHKYFDIIEYINSTIN